jgi:hypothetical protein
MTFRVKLKTPYYTDGTETGPWYAARVRPSKGYEQKMWVEKIEGDVE